MNNNITSPIIDVKNLSKSFNGIQAVQSLSLTINPGTIFGFLGANGSGKTTSLRLLCGLLLPDSGEGRCLGLNLFSDMPRIQMHIGYMPQYFCLYRNLSVYENLDFIARIYEIDDRKNKCAAIIEQFALTEKQHQISGTLSGGWKQRVSLAAALLHEPKLLLLDEPTSGIDPQSRIIIWDYIQELVAKGVTVLLSTHHMDEAERCHKLAYMAHGKVLTYGSAKEIIKSTGLYTWLIYGTNISQLKHDIKNRLSCIQIIEKGDALRLSATNPDIIQRLDPNMLLGYQFQEIPPDLEDVFIYKTQHEGVSE